MKLKIKKNRINKPENWFSAKTKYNSNESEPQRPPSSGNIIYQQLQLLLSEIHCLVCTKVRCPMGFSQSVNKYTRDHNASLILGDLGLPSCQT